MLDLYALKMKKILLDRTILEKNKIIVPPLRLRNPEYTLESLRNSNLCSGVVFARDGLSEIDLVFDVKQATYLNRVKDYSVRSFLVPVGDEMIRCTLNEIYRHFSKNWVIQIRFNRFIVGKPNLVWLPLKPKWDETTSKVSTPQTLLTVEGIWAYVYNDDYPAALDVEVGNIIQSIGLSLGDYLKSLPSGVVPHPMYKRDLHRRMLKFFPAAEEVVRERDEIKALRKRLEREEAGEEPVAAEEREDFDEDEAGRLEEKKKKEEERKKAAKLKPPRSLKKRIMAMGYQVKEGLVKDEGEKKPGKGGKKE